MYDSVLCLRKRSFQIVVQFFEKSFSFLTTEGDFQDECCHLLPSSLFSSDSVGWSSFLLDSSNFFIIFLTMYCGYPFVSVKILNIKGPPPHAAPRLFSSLSVGRIRTEKDGKRRKRTEKDGKRRKKRRKFQI